MTYRDTSAKVKYSPALDGLRAICIILTLLNHVAGVPFFIHGNIGVDIFFALSGFLITLIIADNRISDLKPYLIRRFFRIAPVYYLAFSLTVVLTIFADRLHLGPSRMDQLAEIAVPSLLFSRELANSPTLFGQAWTVGIEEKFYLFWPLILLVLRHGLWRIVIATAIMLAFVMWADDGQIVRGYCGIAFGAIAALLYHRYAFSVNTTVALAAVLLSYGIVHFSHAEHRNLAISAAAALIVPALYSRPSRIRDFLGNPIIAHLGRLTFSIYMLHVLVFFFVKFILNRINIHEWYFVFLLGYLLSITIAQVVYTFFEKPLIDLGRSLAK